MSKDFHPYAAYKGIGGVFAAFGLGSAISYSMDAIRGIGEFHLRVTLLAFGVGCAGLYIFIKSDLMIKAAKECDEESKDNVPEIDRVGRGADWKGMLITAAVFLLYLLYVALSAKGIV